MLSDIVSVLVYAAALDMYRRTNAAALDMYRRTNETMSWRSHSPQVTNSLLQLVDWYNRPAMLAEEEE